MTQMNSDSGNTKDPKAGKPDQPADGRATPEPKKKKKRWLLKGLIGLVALVILLVLLAPTIAGTGIVRSIVLGQVNSSLINGKLDIKDWSFGWFSGCKIEGVSLNDTRDVHLFSAAEITVPISLLKAATGNLDLGDVTISGVDFNAVRGPDGQINIINAFKLPKTEEKTPPSKLPNVKGVIHLEKITGTFEDDPDKVTVGFDNDHPLSATITIKDINQPIEDSVDLGLQVGEKTLAQVKVNGTLSAIQNSLVDIDHLAATQTIELSGGNLAPIADVLRAYKLNLNLAGNLDGKITANVNTLDNISAEAGINLADLSVGGPQLAGDTVAYKTIQVGLKASVTSTNGANQSIKLDLPIMATPAGATTPDEISVHADVPVDSMLGMADVFKAIAANLTKKQSETTTQSIAIAGSGQIKITANVNVANLASQVPHLLHLEQGTSLQSGQLIHETTVTLANGQAVIATQTHLKNFSGTNAGNPVKLADLDTSAGVTAVGGNQPDIRDINLSLASAFATAKGGGASIGKMNIQFTSDLKNLQQQVNQVIDLDSLAHAPAGTHVSLVGTVGGDLHTDGDFTAADSKIAIGADLSATDVNVNIPGRRTINEPKFNLTLAGNIHHTTAEFVQAVRDLSLSIQSSAINYQMAGEIKLGGKFGVTVPTFNISHGSVDLRLLQEEFGGALSLFVPKPADGAAPTILQRLADNSVRIASGSVTISGNGEFDQNGFGFKQPLQITVQPTDITIADEMGTVQTVHVPTIAVVIAGNGSVDNQSIATLKDMSIKTLVGTSDSPMLDVELQADAMAAITNPDMPTGSAHLENGATFSASRIEITHCDGDLARLQATFGDLIPLLVPPTPASGPTNMLQQVMQNVITCTAGQLSASMLASYDGTTLTLNKPLAITITGLTLEQRGGANVNNKPIDNALLAAQIGGSMSISDGHIHGNFHRLSFQLGDQLKIEGSPQSPVDVAVAQSGAVSASGSVQLVQADLPKLINMASVFLPPKMAQSLKQLASGQVTGNIQLQNSPDAITVTGDISVANLTVGQALKNETMHLTFTETMASDFSSVSDASVEIKTSFANEISITNGHLVLQVKQGDTLVPVGLFDKVQGAQIVVDGLDLAKVNALANLLQAMPAGLPQISSGVLTVKADLARNGDTTTANVSQLGIQNLAVKSGNQSFAWPNAISAQLTADVQTLEDPTGQVPILDLLAKVSVTALSADLGLTKISLADNKPILLTGLSDTSKMSVQGGVSVDGDIEPAARLAEVFTGSKPNAFPYKGHYHFDEVVAKDASQPRLHVLGGGAVTQFAVFGPPPAGGGDAPAVFSEDKISIHNGFDFDFGTYSIIIDRANPISVALESTGALAVKVTGTVNDLLVTRQIADNDHVGIEATYDLAKLWTIIKPLLPPDKQQTLADLVISGKQTRTITASGSYPANKPFNEAIAMVDAGGYLTVDNVSTQGITITNFDFPFWLHGGILKTVYPGQPEGQNAPHPATCNDGTLDIGVLAVDLRTDPMLASMQGATADNPHILLKDVSLNPAMAKTMFAKFFNNPAFANASQSKGLVSVSVLQFQTVPMSNLILESAPQNQGLIHVQYSATQLQIGSPLLAVFGNESMTADINNADVQIAAGRLTEDTTMMINQVNPFRMAGVVILSSRKFAPMTAYIPSGLYDHLIPSQYRGFAPNPAVVPMTGDMNNPRIKLDKVISETIKKGLIPGLLGGGNQANQQQSSQQPGGQQQQQQQDPLGQLFQGLGKKHH